MPRPRPEAFREAERWRLALHFEPRGGLAGERLGRGTGSSLEFQDRRTYVPGDDVRHVDWRAYGRTGELLVRQYREEILPKVELVVDASRSMAVDEEKERATVELVLLLTRAALAAGAEVAITALAEGPRRITPAELEAEGLTLDGRRSFFEVLREARGQLARGGERVLVSDLLAPHDPGLLARILADRAGGALLCQLLGPSDVEPPADAALRLEDVESGEELDLVVDGTVRARYLARLRRWSDAAEEAVRREGGRYLRLEAARGLPALARDVLAPAGVLEPNAGAA